MPIRREDRHFYPIDWRELSAAIRFGLSLPSHSGAEGDLRDD